MGKRICKSWCIPGQHLLAGVFLGLFFVCGGLLGCLFLGVCDADGRQALAKYLSDYLQIAFKMAVVQEFLTVFWSELRYGLVAVLLWWTAFGVVGYPILFALRGFLLSFSVGAFIHTFGLGGALPACIVFLFPALFWGPALFLLGIQGLARTKKGSLRVDGTYAGLRPEELRTLILAFILFLLCGFFEYIVLPHLLSFAAKIVL